MTQEADANKLLVIDQSLIDSSGHHLNYTAAVALSGHRAGKSVTVATNKLFDIRTVPAAYKVLRWRAFFTANWFDVLPARRPGLLAAALRFSPRSAARGLANRLLRITFTATVVAIFVLPARYAPRLTGVIYRALNTSKEVLARDGLREIQRRAGLQTRAARNTLQMGRWLVRSVLRLLKLSVALFFFFAALALSPLLPLVLRLASARHNQIFCQPNFSKELANLLREEGIGPRDDVFIHTIGVQQLNKFYDVVARMAPNVRPGFHVVLRRDLFEPLSRPARGESLKEVLRHFADANCFGDRVLFYVDTPELQEQYRRGAGIETFVLPIPPITIAGRIRNGKIDDAEVLTLVYLGSARTEKGFQLLPDAVRAVFQSPDRARVRFIIQSDFNLAGGEPGIPDARDALESYPENFVTLLKAPLTENEYRDLLEESDIILLPYLPLEYRARSSGVLVEALCSGRPVVVPDATSLSSMAEQGGATTFRTSGEFADAVRRAIGSYPELRNRAKRAVDAFSDYHSSENVWRTLAARRSSLPPPHKKRAIILVNDYVGHGTALDRVIENQVRYLRDRDYEVSLWIADVYRWLQETRDLQPSSGALRKIGADSILLFQIDITPKGTARLFDETLRDITVQAQIRNMSFYQLRPEMREWLAAGAPDLVLANYVYCTPLIDSIRAQFQGAFTPITICETHDIQSVQKAYFRKSARLGDGAVDERELEAELHCLAGYDAVMAVSEQDKGILESRLGDVCHVNPRGIKLPLNEPLWKDRPQEFEISTVRELEQIDVLFVGSWHKPNLDGVNWFISEVLHKHLPVCQLHIAGTICRVMDNSIANHPQITKLGFVEDLDEVYSRTKVVIAPLLAGAGLSVKVIEAMAHGVPVVATTVGLRGIESCPIKPTNSAQSFAARILELLNNPQERERNIATARRWVMDHQSYEAYARNMDGILANIEARHCGEQKTTPRSGLAALGARGLDATNNNAWDAGTS